MKRITASIDMARAFNQPQSKKCFTSPSQMISWMNKANRPLKKASNTAPTTVPTAIVATASENFALSFPTRALPASHRAGDMIMMFIMMWMTNESKLRAKISSTLFSKANATIIFKLISWI
jgi:hypothetical protein